MQPDASAIWLASAPACYALLLLYAVGDSCFVTLLPQVLGSVQLLYGFNIFECAAGVSPVLQLLLELPGWVLALIVPDLYTCFDLTALLLSKCAAPE
jgi:hypothetical protein